MENFGEIVYKKPEYQKESPKEPSPEDLAYSEKIAQEKLAKISDPNFKNFALRYMNIEEYRQMIETGVLGAGGREVNVLETRGSALEYLPYLARNAEDHTNWTSTNRSYWLMGNLMDKVRAADGENKRDKLENIREEILKTIMSNGSMYSVLRHTTDELLENYAPAEATRERLLEMRTHLRDSGEYPSKEQIETKAAELAVDPKWLGKFSDTAHLEYSFGSENMAILNRLKNDPEYIQQPGALRAVINALTYSFDKRENTSAFDRHLRSTERQYEVAVIFDNDILKLAGRSERNPWSDLSSSGRLTEEQRRRAVLAAISMMPLKDLENELIAIEEGSGDFAHPVFATVGDDRRRSKPPQVALRWPVLAQDQSPPKTA